MSVVVRPLSEQSAPAWDQFASKHPGGTFFHQSTWSTVLAAAFKHPSLYAYAERDGAITGILPLMQVKTALFGNTLISSPFCVYGGPLSADAESRVALDHYAAEVMARRKATAHE